ncbi:MAG: metallophosphoesterase family protein [Chloroflexota bacterium]
MKVALFADLHGNNEALQAILADIETQNVDVTVCAGDIADPFPGSKANWLEIQQRNIPTVIGNHEEYLISIHDPLDPLGLQNKARFLPAIVSARSLSSQIIADMKALPMTLSIPGPNGDDILVCHASPSHTRRSFSRIMDDEMVADLRRFPHRVIAGGHIHNIWRTEWEGRLLFLCGSGGLPLQGDTVAQYAILTYTDKCWQLEHRQLKYDHDAALRQVRESGFLSEAGPIGWLMYDELWTAVKRVMPFFEYTGKENVPDTLPELETTVKRFLKAIGRWEYLAPLI